MTKIQNRYASAVHSSNLGVDENTVMSDTDVLGAMGIADRVLNVGMTSSGTPVRPFPLAVPLERLFAGDNNAAYDIVRTMAEMVWYEARRVKVKLGRVEAKEMAQACLAWHRDGVCKPCGGHGYALIPGTISLSSHECPACCGDHIPSAWRTPGKRPFELEFKPLHRELARWLVSEMSRASGYAGPAAMRALAPSLNLE